MTKLFLILIILLQVACSSTLEKTNKSFLKKYGSEIDKILDEREKTEIYQSSRRPVILHKQASENEALVREMAIHGYFDSQPNSLEDFQLKLQRELGEYIPDTPTYVRNLGRIQPEIADISYSFGNDPKEYKRDLVSFDNIKIPSHDYFGIQSSLEEKRYDRVDPMVLQRNIDKIHDYFTLENQEINLILLKEKEEIRKNRMAKIFLGKGEEKTVQPELKELDKKEEIQKEKEE